MSVGRTSNDYFRPVCFTRKFDKQQTEPVAVEAIEFNRKTPLIASLLPIFCHRLFSPAALRRRKDGVRSSCEKASLWLSPWCAIRLLGNAGVRSAGHFQIWLWPRRRNECTGVHGMGWGGLGTIGSRPHVRFRSRETKDPGFLSFLPPELRKKQSKKRRLIRGLAPLLPLSFVFLFTFIWRLVEGRAR